MKTCNSRSDELYYSEIISKGGVKMSQNPWQMVQVKMHEEDLRRLNLLATKDRTSSGYQIRFAVQEYLAQRKPDLEMPKKASSKKVLNFKSKK